jgi:LytS/YehU family sensor histidine kinase
MIDRDPQRAQRMVIGLSELLRATLRTGDRQQIPLGQEIELTKLYLEIQQVRFADRLQVDWRVDADLSKLVPAFVLQPLVENAIVHGLSRKPGPGRLAIEVSQEERGMVLRVIDDGLGLDERRVSTGSGGVGLSNLRSRLRRLYGAGSELELVPGAGGGAAATLLIPEASITGS